MEEGNQDGGLIAGYAFLRCIFKEISKEKVNCVVHLGQLRLMD